MLKEPDEHAPERPEPIVELGDELLSAGARYALLDIARELETRADDLRVVTGVLRRARSASLPRFELRTAAATHAAAVASALADLVAVPKVYSSSVAPFLLELAREFHEHAAWRERAAQDARGRERSASSSRARAERRLAEELGRCA